MTVVVVVVGFIMHIDCQGKALVLGSCLKKLNGIVLIQLSDMSSFAISNKPMLIVIISNMMKSLGDVFLGFEGMPFTNQSGTLYMLFQYIHGPVVGIKQDNIQWCIFLS